ncbi:hypothetical protein ACI2I2_01405 [Scandinavium sp. NPDC088450]|uniref:hypothetical protein n=1 Tax=Scandinavium sp. NPDC088450 TaxID=3364514 RepID=UPI00384F515A
MLKAKYHQPVLLNVKRKPFPFWILRSRNPHEAISMTGKINSQTKKSAERSPCLFKDDSLKARLNETSRLRRLKTWIVH